MTQEEQQKTIDGTIPDIPRAVRRAMNTISRVDRSCEPWETSWRKMLPQMITLEGARQRIIEYVNDARYKTLKSEDKADVQRTLRAVDGLQCEVDCRAGDWATCAAAEALTLTDELSAKDIHDQRTSSYYGDRYIPYNVDDIAESAVKLAHENGENPDADEMTDLGLKFSGHVTDCEYRDAAKIYGKMLQLVKRSPGYLDSVQQDYIGALNDAHIENHQEECKGCEECAAQCDTCGSYEHCDHAYYEEVQERMRRQPEEDDD